MEDATKHVIAKEIYSIGKAFLWGLIPSFLTWCFLMLWDLIGEVDDTFKPLWLIVFYGSPFFAIIIRYIYLAYKWVMKWK